MPPGSLAVIVPTWNGAHLLGGCLDSLARQSVRPHVIVVDNGSTDRSVEFVTSRHPGVQLVCLPANRGFAGGVNAGIAAARAGGARWIGLLNNDAVAEEHWVERLLDVLRAHPQVGIATARILDATGRLVDSTGDFYTVWGIPYPRGRGQPNDARLCTPGPVFAASGGASLYRVTVFEEVGVFDESFFAYYEDVDLSFRARLAGWDIHYVPDALVWHAMGATSSTLGDFTRYHVVKNHVYLYAKNLPAPLLARHLPTALAGLGWLLAADLRAGRLSSSMRALREAAGHAGELRERRRQVQAARVLTSAQVDAWIERGWPATMSSPADRIARVFPGGRRHVPRAVRDRGRVGDLGPVGGASPREPVTGAPEAVVDAQEAGAGLAEPVAPTGSPRSAEPSRRKAAASAERHSGSGSNPAARHAASESTE